MSVVRSYRDGDRLVIVIENCTGEVAKRVSDFMALTLGVYTPEQYNVTGLEPPAKVQDQGSPNIQEVRDWKYPEIPKEQDIKETDYKGTGWSLKEALYHDGLSAAIYLLTFNRQPWVLEGAKCFAQRALLDSNLTGTPKQLYKLYQDTSPLVGNFVRTKILPRVGYKTMEEFVKNADPKVVQKAFMVLRKEILSYCQ